MDEKKITINPVTRIEGHAKITIQLGDDDTVREARFHVNEFRGFEKFCEGRLFTEMPNITRNTERYHEKGFEVVGVHLDGQKALVDRFFASQSLPWTTVVDADGMADKCGVESIPGVSSRLECSSRKVPG